MSGHSKWSTIKRKKGALDQKRGKLFSSMGREITISARLFGGDIDTNPRLRQAIKKAKSINMPNANINKAIKKGSGTLENVIYEEASYEGYGPNGVAVFIEAITDNRNRTVAEIRHVLSKFGGSLGQSGSVAWNFDKMGIVFIEDSNMSEEEALDISVQMDANDFKFEDKFFKIFLDHNILYEKIELIEKKGIDIDSSFIELIPKNFVEISDEDFSTIEKLIDTLDDLEDVQNVYSNYKIKGN